MIIIPPFPFSTLIQAHFFYHSLIYLMFSIGIFFSLRWWTIASSSDGNSTNNACPFFSYLQLQKKTTIHYNIADYMSISISISHIYNTCWLAVNTVTPCCNVPPLLYYLINCHTISNSQNPCLLFSLINLTKHPYYAKMPEH